jgi:hypothetical protein
MASDGHLGGERFHALNEAPIRRIIPAIYDENLLSFIIEIIARTSSKDG